MNSRHPMARPEAQQRLADALEKAHAQERTINTDTGTYEAVLACLQSVMTMRLTPRRARILLLLAGDSSLSMDRLGVECQCTCKAAQRAIAHLFAQGLIKTPHQGHTHLTASGHHTAASIVACTALGEAAFYMRQLKPNLASRAIATITAA